MVTTNALGPARFRAQHLERTKAAPVENIQRVHVHRLPIQWLLRSNSGSVQAGGRRLRLPGAERVGDLNVGPVVRGFLWTLDQVAPTDAYASSFRYLLLHQLAAWTQRHLVPVVLHGAIHPEDGWVFDRSSSRRSRLRAAGNAAYTAHEARYIEGSVCQVNSSAWRVLASVPSCLKRSARRLAHLSKDCSTTKQFGAYHQRRCRIVAVLRANQVLQRA